MMHRTMIAVCLLLCAAALLQAQDIAPSAWQTESTGWKPFMSKEGSFQVLAPAWMKERVESVNTPLGALQYYTFTCRDGADLTYLVRYVDYPDFTVHSDSTDLLKEFFEATMEEELLASGGELAYEEDVVIEGYRGKMWRINVPTSRSVIRTRVFVSGSRFYCIQAIAGRAKALNPSSDRFLRSFRLLL